MQAAGSAYKAGFQAPPRRIRAVLDAGGSLCGRGRARVLHLLYERFWHKVFYDLGLVHTKEPFQKLVNQDMILGESSRFYDDDRTDENVAEVNI